MASDSGHSVPMASSTKVRRGRKGRPLPTRRRLRVQRSAPAARNPATSRTLNRRSDDRTLRWTTDPHVKSGNAAYCQRAAPPVVRHDLLPRASRHCQLEVAVARKPELPTILTLCAKASPHGASRGPRAVDSWGRGARFARLDPLQAAAAFWKCGERPSIDLVIAPSGFEARA